MRILVSNDDGVHAEGIQVLYKTLSEVAEVTVVAPTHERSTSGHGLNLDMPLRLETVAENVYGCTGLPADCVLLAIGHLLKERRPDLIISGINRGGNLGQDLYYSGTMAAAREGALHLIPAIAVSTVIHSWPGITGHHEKYHPNYKAAAEFIKKLVMHKIHQKIPPYSMLNVNVPDAPADKIAGVKLTDLGLRNYSEGVEERIDCRNRKYYWIAANYQGFGQIPNSDCQAIEENFISLTPLPLISSIPTDFTAIRELHEKL